MVKVKIDFKYHKLYLIVIALVALNGLRFAIGVKFPDHLILNFCHLVPDFIRRGVPCVVGDSRNIDFIDFLIPTYAIAIMNAFMIIVIALRELTHFHKSWGIALGCILVFMACLYVGPLNYDIISGQGTRLSGLPLWLLLFFLTNAWIISIGTALIFLMEPSKYKSSLENLKT